MLNSEQLLADPLVRQVLTPSGLVPQEAPPCGA
jgi:hypothetical protein